MSTVETLTHLKEKWVFLEQANTELRGGLDQLDRTVADDRDRLARIKHLRDALRQENILLRTNSGLLGHTELLRDMEGVVDEVGCSHSLFFHFSLSAN